MIVSACPPQVLILLSESTFELYPQAPGSEKIAGISEKFVKFSAADLGRWGCSRLSVRGKPGDICVFRGGEIVHGSPAVGVGEPTRFCTYANFQVS